MSGKTETFRPPSTLRGQSSLRSAELTPAAGKPERRSLSRVGRRIGRVTAAGVPALDPADRGLRIRLLEPRVVPVALIMMLFTLPFTATQAFLVTLTEVRRLDVPVGLFFPIYAGVLLLVRFFLRRLFDRWPFRVFMACGLVSLACAMVALAAMHGWPLMVVGALGLTGSYGVMCTVCQATAMLLARPGGRALANGTFYVGIDLGMALGPLCGGFLFGHAPLEWFFPAFLLTIPAILAVYAWGRRGLAHL